MLKVRIRFSKSGALVYIGHLDVMRYFQKLFRRADIPVAYSEGFSPHQLLSFSHPLPLGMESTGEYADVVLTQKITTAEAISRLREQSVNEISIMSFKELPEKCDNAMASVAAAQYEIRLPDDHDDLMIAVDKLMAEDEIVITKKTKKSEKEVNIRPLIMSLEALSSKLIRMTISSGSTDNLKPEHVLGALNKFLDKAVITDTVMITRIDQYMKNGEDLISLNEVGKDIV